MKTRLPVSLLALVALAALSGLGIHPVHAQEKDTPIDYEAMYAKHLGSQEVAKVPQDVQPKIYADLILARDKSKKLLEAAVRSGKQKAGQSEQWAYDTYRKPLLKKYKISENCLSFIKGMGIACQWPWLEKY